MQYHVYAAKRSSGINDDYQYLRECERARNWCAGVRVSEVKWFVNGLLRKMHPDCGRVIALEVRREPNPAVAGRNVKNFLHNAIPRWRFAISNAESYI